MKVTAFDHVIAVVTVIGSLEIPPVTMKVSGTVTEEAFTARQPPETSQTTRSVATIASPTMIEVLIL